MTPTAVNRLRAAWLLSALVAVLMAAASAGGLWIDGLYRDAASVSARLRASDLVTLAVAAPVLAAALWRSRRGSARAQLVWAAMLAYAVYMTALIFQADARVPGATAFDPLEPAIAVAFLAATAIMLANLDAARLPRRHRPPSPARPCAALPPRS